MIKSLEKLLLIAFMLFVVIARDCTATEIAAESLHTHNEVPFHMHSESPLHSPAGPHGP